MSKRKQLTVRLSDTEQRALSQVPGPNLSEKIRFMILNQATTSFISASVADEVEKKLTPVSTAIRDAERTQSQLALQLHVLEKLVQSYSIDAAKASRAGTEIADSTVERLEKHHRALIKKLAEQLDIVLRDINLKLDAVAPKQTRGLG